jgi:hypothetical protein
MNAGNLVAAASVLIAATAIFLSYRQAIKERQLNVALSLGSEYREAWRTRWHVIPAALSAANDEPASLPPAVFEVLLDALAWIDWFGVACEEKVIQRPDFVFRTVGPSMAQMIQRAERIIADDTSAHGERYWGGVTFVRRRLSELGILRTESSQWRVAAGESDDSEIWETSPEEPSGSSDP